MSQALSAWILSGLWIVFMLRWGRAARAVYPAAGRYRDPLYRWNLLATVIGLVLILTEFGDVGPFGLRVLPNEMLWFWLGLALTLAGMALALWARGALGPYFSGRIELKTGHRLVQEGPYRFLRHPIYAGIILAALGSALADCDFDAVLGFALIAGSFVIKLRREERFVAANFGEEWARWRAHTWALVPFVY